MKRSIAFALGLALLAASLPVRAANDPARAVAAETAATLEASYVFPSRAQVAGEMLRGNAAAGAYDGLRDAALATRLNDDLAAVLHDKHVRLRPFTAGVLASELIRDRPVPPAQVLRDAGYRLGRIAHLPGNVGYIELRAFPPGSDEMNVVFDAFTNSVAYSGAVVLDLRRNHGGTPASVGRLLSHFFPPKTHLNDFIGRGDGEPPIASSTYTTEVSGPQIAAPLYVLISAETFSAGEECAYDVQALKRGTLIGAVTGGGANPGRLHPVADRFMFFVPEQRARNPITLTNWEGVGVKPDIEVASDRALITAYGMALDARLRDASVLAFLKTGVAPLRAKLDTMTDAEILAL